MFSQFSHDLTCVYLTIVWEGELLELRQGDSSNRSTSGQHHGHLARRYRGRTFGSEHPQRRAGASSDKQRWRMMEMHCRLSESCCPALSFCEQVCKRLRRHQSKWCACTLLFLLTMSVWRAIFSDMFRNAWPVLTALIRSWICKEIIDNCLG